MARSGTLLTGEQHVLDLLLRLPRRARQASALCSPRQSLVAMALKWVAGSVVLCILSNSALAATVAGRITYIASDQHQLMLDNSDMYVVGSLADVSSLAIADRVTINWDKKGGEDVITSMVKSPLRSVAGS